MKKSNGWDRVDTSVSDGPNKLQQFIANKPFGFLRDGDMEELIALDRLMPCLVRCERCRFTCAAQDVAHLLKCVRAGGEHVRDVAMAHGYKERAEKWVQPGVAMSKPSPALALSTEANVKGPWKSKAPEMPWFNEAECGGAFDGRQVTSDADPGL